MLTEFRTFAAARANLEELVEASAQARALTAEFEALGVDIPEWLVESTKIIRKEIRAKNADAIADKLRTLKARKAALATPDEKRTAIQDEIDALEKKQNAPV